MLIVWFVHEVAFVYVRACFENIYLHCIVYIQINISYTCFKLIKIVVFNL